MSLTLHGTKPDVLASRVSEQWDSLQSKRTVNRQKWTEIESYLFATDTTSIDGGSSFDHTTHIPVVAELKEELESLIYSTVYPSDDFLGWRPYDLQASTRTKREKILAYIKNRHSLNGFERTLRSLVQDLIIYGNAFVQVTHTSGLTGDYSGPKPIRISPYDIVFDPTATDFNKTTKIVRSVMTLGDFKKFASQVGLDEQMIKEIILRRYQKSGSYIDTNKNKQFLPDGFTSLQSYYSSGVVELLWLYGDIWDTETEELLTDRCVVVADRTTVVMNEERRDSHIHKASWAQKPDNLWSQGPLDKVIGMNYQINHRENSKSDALDRYIFPDRVYIGDVEEVYDVSTGQTKFLAPEGGGVRDLTPDTTVLTADLHQDRLLSQSRSAAGLPPQLQGYRTPGEKTLGEVTQLMDAGMRKFLHKASQFEMDLLEPMVRSEIILARENFSSFVQAETVDEMGLPTFIEITEDDLRSNGVLVPIGARRFALENKQLNMINTLANSNLGQIIGAHLNTYNLAQAVEELGGLTQFKAFEKFAAVEEQADMQIAQAVAEQQVTTVLSEQSMQETMLE